MSTSSRPLSVDALHELIRDTKPYLSCDECFEKIDSYVERLSADPDHQDVALEVHLAACGACAEEVATLVELLADGPDQPISRT